MYHTELLSDSLERVVCSISGCCQKLVNKANGVILNMIVL